MAYRDITPAPTREAEARLLPRRQSVWVMRSDGVQSALYAGKEMLIAPIAAERAYRLSYLDMLHPTRFADVEAAKACAADFARSVLLTMLKYVGTREDDRSLRDCLLCDGR